jgi:hypothetical protein
LQGNARPHPCIADDRFHFVFQLIHHGHARLRCGHGDQPLIEDGLIRLNGDSRQNRIESLQQKEQWPSEDR